MKILLINSVLGIGSTGRIVESLYNFFKGEGHDVKVAYGRNRCEKVPGEDQFCFYSKLNVYSHALLSRCSDKAGLAYSKKATKKLIKFIDEFNPDVVNLHNLHGYYLNVPMLLKYLGQKNIKCVFTLHDSWLFTGHCACFYYNKCDGYQTGCKACKYKNVYPKSIACNRAEKNLALKKELLDGIKNKSFICPSKWLKNFAEKSILAGEKIEVVYNAIDYDIFNPSAANYFDKRLLPKTKYILCVANYWTEEKGLYKVIELSKHLKEGLKIVMIGYLNNKSLLNDNIVYVEHTNDARELAFFYANAECFFNPTLEDNFPTVNIEALACGTPVILFKGCSGGEEIVDDCVGKIIDSDVDLTNLYKTINNIKMNVFGMSEVIKKLCNNEFFLDEYKRICCN